MSAMACLQHLFWLLVYTHAAGRKMSRTPLMLFLFVSAIVASAQTAGDFGTRYGDPDVERFVIRPGVTLTVAYGSDRTGCQMIVESKRSILKSDNESELMAKEIVPEVLEEILPESSGDTLLGNIEQVVGCDLQVHSTHYDVTINASRERACHASERGEANMLIVREDRPCGTGDSSGDVSIAQTAIDLHNRYGAPDAQRYVVRPGITLMVSYGSDQSACEMVIERTRSIIPRDEAENYVRPEVMTEIINEVLPEADRGKLLLGVVTKSGCNDLETMDYENVTIHRFRHRCRLPNPEIEGEATITRKNSSCALTSGKLSDSKGR
jgi:hypothetical protein